MISSALTVIAYLIPSTSRFQKTHFFSVLLSMRQIELSFDRALWDPWIATIATHDRPKADHE
jgi:hypothetical protein